jgi:hypothetical protein
VRYGPIRRPAWSAGVPFLQVVGQLLREGGVDLEPRPLEELRRFAALAEQVREDGPELGVIAAGALQEGLVLIGRELERLVAGPEADRQAPGSGVCRIQPGA